MRASTVRTANRQVEYHGVKLQCRYTIESEVIAGSTVYSLELLEVKLGEVDIYDFLVSETPNFIKTLEQDLINLEARDG